VLSLHPNRNLALLPRKLGKGIEGRVDQCDDSTTPGTEDESETSSVTLYVVVSHYPLDPQLTIYNAQCYAKAIKGRLSSN
jgi:hypothetical protein